MLLCTQEVKGGGGKKKIILPTRERKQKPSKGGWTRTKMRDIKLIKVRGCTWGTKRAVEKHGVAFGQTGGGWGTLLDFGFRRGIQMGGNNPGCRWKTTTKKKKCGGVPKTHQQTQTISSNQKTEKQTQAAEPPPPKRSKKKHEKNKTPQKKRNFGELPSHCCGLKKRQIEKKKGHYWRSSEDQIKRSTFIKGNLALGGGDGLIVKGGICNTKWREAKKKIPELWCQVLGGQGVKKKVPNNTTDQK